MALLRQLFHLNDSVFWMLKNILTSLKNSLRFWTVKESIVGIAGII